MNSIIPNNQSEAVNHLMLLIKELEQLFPYHRNDRTQQIIFELFVPGLLNLVNYLKHNFPEIHITQEHQNQLGALIRIIRRISEYLLSVKRQYEQAIILNEWALHLNNQYTDTLSSLWPDIIKLNNHLGYAYMYLYEVTPNAKNELLTKALHYLETGLKLNKDLEQSDKEALESEGYSCCVMAQVNILKKEYDRAIEQLIAAYRCYAIDEFIISSPIEECLQNALNILDNSSFHDKQAGNLYYQQSIVLGSLADVYMQRDKEHDYEYAMLIYPTIINFIKRYWGESTLQIGDIYCKYAALYEKKANFNHAKIYYKEAYSIYHRIAGSTHEKTHWLYHRVCES